MVSAFTCISVSVTIANYYNFFVIFVIASSSPSSSSLVLFSSFSISFSFSGSFSPPFLLFLHHYHHEQLAYLGTYYMQGINLHELPLSILNHMSWFFDYFCLTNKEIKE